MESSSTVQIITVIASIGGVVFGVILGFGLNVWWNNRQQKKRDEREMT